MPETTLNVPPCAIAKNDPKNAEDDENQPAMGYQQTIMYGTYSKALGDYAREEAKRQKVEEKMRKRRTRKETAELAGEKTRGKTYRTTSKVITYVWKHTFAKLGQGLLYTLWIPIHYCPSWVCYLQMLCTAIHRVSIQGAYREVA